MKNRDATIFDRGLTEWLNLETRWLDLALRFIQCCQTVYPSSAATAADSLATSMRHLLLP